MHKKLLAILLGSVLSLILFEGILRITKWSNDSENKSSQKMVDNLASDTYRIVTIGNSYTEGVGAPREFSYPNTLNKMLAKREKKYQVINRGYHNTNTSRILEYLPEWIKADRPQLAFIMVGEPNFWNRYGYRDYTLKTGKADHTESWLRNFYVYNWLELVLNADNLFHLKKNSTYFKSIELNTENRKQLGYLWFGYLEKGAIRNRSAFIHLKELTKEQIREALEYLKIIAIEDKNAYAYRLIAEVRFDMKQSRDLIFQELRESIKHSKKYDHLFYLLMQKMVEGYPSEESASMLREIKESYLKKFAHVNVDKVEALTEKVSENRNFVAEDFSPEDIKTLALMFPTAVKFASDAILSPIDLESKFEIYSNILVFNPFNPSSHFMNYSAGIFKNSKFQQASKDLVDSLDQKVKVNLENVFDIPKKKIVDWVIYDLEQMINLLQQHNIKVVVQNYPRLRDGNPRLIDDALDNWAQTRLPKDVIYQDIGSDLEKTFKLAKNREHFYSNQLKSRDHHLNELGYFEIAKLMEPLVP